MTDTESKAALVCGLFHVTATFSNNFSICFAGAELELFVVAGSVPMVRYATQERLTSMLISYLELLCPPWKLHSVARSVPAAPGGFHLRRQKCNGP